MKSSQRIKKEIKVKSLMIRLYEVDQVDWNQEGISNIKAFDNKGDLIWIVQPPTYNSFYFDMNTI